MPDPYLGEIRMFGGNFPPQGWLFCDGRLLDIAGNPELFELIGTTYGGDGENTFALPDLRGRLPVHQGLGYELGSAGGVEHVALTADEMPVHAHLMLATDDTATQTNPGAQVLARFSQANIDPYLEETPPNVSLAAPAITSAGGGQPHSNLQPYLCVDYIICVLGTVPAQV